MELQKFGTFLGVQQMTSCSSFTPSLGHVQQVFAAVPAFPEANPSLEGPEGCLPFLSQLASLAYSQP